MSEHLRQLHRELEFTLAARNLSAAFEVALTPWQRRALALFGMDQGSFHARAEKLGRLISTFTDPEEPSAA